MRGADKLLQTIDGTALLTRSARIALASSATETIAVLGANRSARLSALSGLPIRTVINADWHAGMGSSLAVGAAALSPDADAVIVMLADMPDIDADLLNRLIAAAAPGAILRPVTADTKPGNPVLFTHSYIPALTTLTGDEGARTVIAAHPESVVTIPANDAILTDLDTPEAWDEWRRANED